MSNTCVYCAQGEPAPTTGYTRTCPGCGRSYLATFPRDLQEKRESGERPAMSGQMSEGHANSAAIAPDLPLITPDPVFNTSGERPATASNAPNIVRSPVQGSLF
jgi:hypothetical protein